MEELDGVESQYIRIELKTKPVDLPKQDVRRAPGDRTPYESGMIRILRVTCAAQSACPASAASGKSGGGRDREDVRLGPGWKRSDQKFFGCAGGTSAG